MSSEIVPINRTNASSSTGNKNDIWFNAFNIAPGQDENIRWLSRPNQQLVQQKYSHDTEKFRITFDAENFQPEQIKIYIQNGQLTISGVYEERSEGRFMQKQFERSFDIPSNADVDSMASYITPAHMLVVEIPLSANPTPKVDHLTLNNTQNNQRRLSFSLNKYNTSDNQGSLSTSNDLSPPGQSVRRTSVTKTTTTTTSTGASGIPPEAAELLRSVDSTTGNSSQTYSSKTTERRSSNTNNQLSTSEPNASSTTTKHTTLTTSNLGDLPIDIPPELLASGGTITIQKRRVSINKAADNSTPDQGVSLSSTQSNNTQSSTTTTKTTTSSTDNTNQSSAVPVNRSNDTQTSSSTTQNTNQTGEVTVNRTANTTSTTSNALNQPQSNTTERRGSKSTTSTHSNSAFTLEEFLQNKTWNPTLVDGPNGKKFIHMRLQMKPGTKAEDMKISLNGYDFRVEVDNKVTTEGGLQATEHSYRQVTLFPTCEIDQLTSELKDDGYLHIKVPINL